MRCEVRIDAHQVMASKALVIKKKRFDAATMSQTWNKVNSYWEEVERRQESAIMLDSEAFT